MQHLRFYIYLRKSSESEERQELSIPGQERELRGLAERRHLQVVGDPLREERSAKEPGRPVFDEMVSRINAGRADGIICWKSDRLARNPVDGGRIIYDLGKQRIKALVTPDRTYTGTAEDKLLLSINFGMATKYSDDLSDNVKRGNRDALTAGHWPGMPKLGYLRDANSGRLVPDPVRFAQLAELWQRLLAGDRPLDLLAALNGTTGFRTRQVGKRGGRPLSKGGLYRLLRDPFYTGLMVRKGESYAGTHPPMVATEDFAHVQALLDGRVRPLARPQHRFFTYGGLIRCAACGAGVTAKVTTNRYGTRYTYYYCCRKERRYGYCPEGSIQEEELEAQLVTLFGALRPPALWCKHLLQYLRSRQADRTATKDQGRKNVEALVQGTERQLTRLRDLLVRGVLTEEDYASERLRLLSEQSRLRERLDETPDPSRLVEPVEESLKWLNRAKELFERGTPEERRTLVKTLTWHLTLGGKKLRVEAKKTTALLGQWSSSYSESAWIDHVGTSTDTPDAEAGLHSQPPA